MAIAVRARAKRGEYNSVTDGNEFAKLLTEHFRDFSHDKHLFVSFSPGRLPEESPSPSPDNFFADPEICGATAVAAMNFPSPAARNSPMILKC
jgi:hypothetical protein